MSINWNYKPKTTLDDKAFAICQSFMYQNHREIEMKWENKENTKPCEEDCNIPSFKLVFLESMTLCIVKICETFWAVNYDT